MEKSGRKHRLSFESCVDVNNAGKCTVVFSHKVNQGSNSCELEFLFMAGFANAMMRNTSGAEGSPADLSLNSAALTEML